MKFNVSNYQYTQMVLSTKHELTQLNIGQVLSLHVYGLIWRQDLQYDHAKKERGQYPAMLSKQAWLRDDLLYEKRILYPLWDTADPEQAR